LLCAHLIKQGSSLSETTCKRIDNEKIVHIIVKYSLKMPSLVQYFVVMSKQFFLHFRSISNKLKNVVSIRVDMSIKSSICNFSTDLSHSTDH
ncbi:hypothetical protein T06_11510, partial [Trichinella sp. T6]